MKTHILLSFVLILLQNESYGEEVEPGPEDDKIVGGYKTNIKEFPHQVLLNMKKGQERHVCGGSILSEKYILTAAHCVSPKIPLKSSKCHPKYNSKNFDYDACVLELEKTLTLNGKTTKAVTLIDSGKDIPAGTNVTVAGWGFTSGDSGGAIVNTATKVQMGIVSYGAFQQCSTKPVVFANIGNKEIRQFIKKITGI
ncbi:unnamed protein product [Leptidea sinapis]|uniref:Peptidase S1 domain-containing protein n=1 Tax=Leptidea sinapis TaxID=189913 RepID=A0A5E4Q358_9NEOP|nr:unnamed protein product [Leptidea sinapis]